MSALFTCTVPGVPVPQSRARTTSRGTFYGKRASAHRKALKFEFWHVHHDEKTVMGIKCMTERGSLAVPVSVLIDIAGAQPTGDLDNHAKMVLDALVDAGVLATDSVSVVRELVVRVVDGTPRTEVTVTAAGERGRA